MAFIVLGLHLDGVLAERKVVVERELYQSFPLLVFEVPLIAVQKQLYAALLYGAVVVGDLGLDSGGSVLDLRTWLGVFGLYLRAFIVARDDGGCGGGGALPRGSLIPLGCSSRGLWL
jgi:hypothetical protein